MIKIFHICGHLVFRPVSFLSHFFSKYDHELPPIIFLIFLKYACLKTDAIYLVALYLPPSGLLMPK